MQNHLKVLIFDVDGVIIDPRAYKIGINKTIEFICRQLGLANATTLQPSANEIAYFESCGVHDDWDITNIIIALILFEINCYFNKKRQPIDFTRKDIEQKLQTIELAQLVIQRPDYLSFVDQLGVNHDFVHPPTLALNMLSLKLKDQTGLSNYQGWIDLLKDFLVGTRSPYESYGTKLFQNIILGADEFNKTYGLPSLWDGLSLLRTEDKVCINRSSSTKIKELIDDKQYKFSVYTARPSLPPAFEKVPLGYSPEAEIALQSANLSNLPLVALGMMQWLGEKYNQRPEDLVKPNSTQAMAALLAAFTGKNDSLIMDEAYAVDKQNKNADETPFLAFKNQKLVVYVFEDIITGIKAMQKAAEKLKMGGYDIIVKPLGIAEDRNKLAALKECCHRVFPDINLALEFAIAD